MFLTPNKKLKQLRHFCLQNAIKDQLYFQHFNKSVTFGPGFVWMGPVSVHNTDPLGTFDGPLVDSLAQAGGCGDLWFGVERSERRRKTARHTAPEYLKKKPDYQKTLNTNNTY